MAAWIAIRASLAGEADHSISWRRIKMRLDECQQERQGGETAHEPGAWRSIRPSGGLAGGRPFHYAHRVSAGERWTDEAVLRESERWVYVPPDGTRLEDEQRLLVHLPRRWGQSRVWRSWVPDEKRAGELIEDTIGEVRAGGGGRLISTGPPSAVRTAPNMTRMFSPTVTSPQRMALGAP